MIQSLPKEKSIRPKIRLMPNRGMECVNSAVSNLLLYLRDEKTATSFYNSFRDHRFVNPDGSTWYPLIPQIVSDLTNGTYRAVLRTHPLEGMEKYIQQTYGEKTDDVVSTIRQGIDQGVIVPGSILTHIPNLCICYCTTLDDTVGHALVRLGKTKYIDNGICKTYDQIPRGLLGIMGIDKVCNTLFEQLEYQTQFFSLGSARLIDAKHPPLEN